MFGFVEENGGRVIETNLKEGTAISIPQGLMHFAQNLDCKPAQFLANFPTRDPGVQTTIENFLRLDERVIRSTLQVRLHMPSCLPSVRASAGACMANTRRGRSQLQGLRWQPPAVHVTSLCEACSHSPSHRCVKGDRWREGGVLMAKSCRRWMMTSSQPCARVPSPWATRALIASAPSAAGSKASRSEDCKLLNRR